MENYFTRNKLILIISMVLFPYCLAEASLTIEDEKKLGREFYDNMEKNSIIYHNLRVDEYLNILGNKIVAKIPQSPFEFHFSLINSSAINAFATPGGYVYVNIGLINLVEDESELASVLAHEISHVSARHIADIVDKSKKVNIASLAAILAGAFLGGSGDITAAVATISMATATTLNLKYSREHEEEADRLGLLYLTEAGYDGNSMLDFLKKMRQHEYYSSKVPSYFLTHPGTDERIRYLDALLQTRYKKSGSKAFHGQLRRIQTFLMLEKNNPDSNLKYFQSAVAKNSADIDSLYGLAITQKKLGSIVQCLENFHIALKLAPDDVDILREIGIAYLENGKPKEANQHLINALKIDGDDLTALSYLGKSYEAEENYQSAVGIYKQLEKKKSVDPEVLYSLAFAYGKLNNQGESHYNFGLYFKKKNKPESAAFHFKEALKYFPKDSPQAIDITKQMKPDKPRETIIAPKPQEKKKR